MKPKDKSPKPRVMGQQLCPYLRSLEAGFSSFLCSISAGHTAHLKLPASPSFLKRGVPQRTVFQNLTPEQSPSKGPPPLFQVKAPGWGHFHPLLQPQHPPDYWQQLKLPCFNLLLISGAREKAPSTTVSRQSFGCIFLIVHLFLSTIYYYVQLSYSKQL